MGGGGITAAGIIVLLLALIGLAVGLYYAYVCLRARPVRPRQHVDCEDGPLIAIDPDVNGNVEDTPVEATAPTDDDSDAKKRLISDDTDNGKIILSESNGPLECTPNGLRKDKESVLVPIEEKPEPVKLVHENETSLAVNHKAGLAAPIGFVTPNNTGPKEITYVQPQTPKKEESAMQERSAPEIIQPDDSPIPILVPAVIVKKPYSESDEEDGLLLKKRPSQDDSLELVSAPSQEVPSIPSSPSKKNQNSSPVKINELPKTHPKIPDTDGANKQVPETVNTQREVNNAEDTQPPVLVDPTPPNVQREKAKEEEIKDPVLSEVSKANPQPVLIKEEEEHLQSILEDTKLPAVVIIPGHCTGDDDDQSGKSDPDDNLVKEPETSEPSSKTYVSAAEINAPVTSETEFPGVVYLETIKPPENDKEEIENDIAAEDPQITPEKIVSIEEKPTEKVQEIEPQTLPISTADVPLQNVKDQEKDKDIVGETKVDIPKVVVIPVSPVNDGESDEENAESENKKVDIPKVVVIPVSPVNDGESDDENVESEDVNIDASIEEKAPENKENFEIPSVVVIPVTPVPGNEEDSEDETPVESNATPMETNKASVESDNDAGEANKTPLESNPPKDKPLESVTLCDEVPPDVPLEAEGSYYSDSMDEGSMLEVIKEEDSIGSESYESDTETSEPEVTQYTFEAGSLVPSISDILADEISSTLEPKVTKISRISELESSDPESEPVQIVNKVSEGMQEEQVTPPVSDHKISPKENTSVDGSDSSTAESEGDETETELEEDVVSVPTLVIQPSSPTKDKVEEAREADSEMSESESAEEDSVEEDAFVKPIVPQDETIISKSSEASPITSTPFSKTEPSTVNCADHTPQVSNINASDLSAPTSSLSSSPSGSDLSDEEVTSLANKSKIPRLVERHGS